jgi:aerobic carbon-monoxide dehydrogenase medium subunit
MNFEYLSPSSLSEALSLLKEYGDKAKIIAGGTDLYIKLNKREIRPHYIIDLEGIRGLDEISRNPESELIIGPLATIRSLEQSPELKRRFPLISSAAGNLGSVAIRNVATVGGNLCNALPSAETAPALIALSAVLRITSAESSRKVSLEEFFTGHCRTVLKNDEILTGINVPEPAANTRGIYYKYSQRGTIDPAVVNMAIIVAFEPDNRTCREARIVLGAVAPTPLRAKKAEDLLKGEKISPTLIAKCGEKAAETASPRTSAEFKRNIIRVFVGRALQALQN